MYKIALGIRNIILFCGIMSFWHIVLGKLIDKLFNELIGRIAWNVLVVFGAADIFFH